MLKYILFFSEREAMHIRAAAAAISSLWFGRIIILIFAMGEVSDLLIMGNEDRVWNAEFR